MINIEAGIRFLSVTGPIFLAACVFSVIATWDEYWAPKIRKYIRSRRK